MAATETDRWQGFILYPSGQIEQVDSEGEMGWSWSEPGLFDDLLLAGYPLTKDDRVKHFDGIIDLSVDPSDPSEVTVYTVGPEPREHRMGRASELFLGWYRREVVDSD